MSRKHISLEERLLLDQHSGRGSHLPNPWQANCLWSHKSLFKSQMHSVFLRTHAGDKLLREGSILLYHLSSLDIGWFSALNMAAIVSWQLNLTAARHKTERQENFKITLCNAVRGWGIERVYQLLVVVKMVWAMCDFRQAKHEKTSFDTDVSRSS